MCNQCNNTHIGNGPPGGLDFGLLAGVQYRDDFVNLIAARNVGTPNAPTLGTIPGTTIQTLEWSASALNELHFVLELDHDYAEGQTTLIPHVHWDTASVGVGTVIWGLEYALKKAGCAIVTGTLSTTVTAPGVANQLVNTNIGASGLVLPAQFAVIGTQIHCRLYRDGATDTHAAVVHTSTFGNHYQVNSFGSRQVTVK